MRALTLFLGAALFIAPHVSRADTILMTVHTRQQQFRGSARYQGRIPLMSFQDTIATPQHYHHIAVSAEWSAALPQFLTALTDNEVTDLTIEFFHPDARGRDSLYYTVKMTGGAVTHLGASFDETPIGGAPRTVMQLRFYGDQVTYTTPGGSPSAVSAIVPRVVVGGRAMIAASSSESMPVTACMVDVTGPPAIPAEVSAGPHSFRATSVAFSMTRATTSGGGFAVRRQLDSLRIRKPAGASSSAIASATSAQTMFTNARISCGDFPRSAESVAYGIELTSPSFTAFNTSASGGQPTDRLSMSGHKLTVREMKTGLSGVFDINVVP